MGFFRRIKRSGIVRRISSWWITRKEVKRRLEAGEEAQKCYKIGLRGEADFSGKTE